MKILITNDDGIFAPGIRALIRAFVQVGHEVYVCAPNAQRSAAGHSLTIHRAIDVSEASIEGTAGAWAIDGTPVDCVKLGVKTLCPQVEFVVSGINRGYNAGSDVLYSGTVGAAMEGALNDLPAMAVSLADSREDAYDRAAALALRCFDRLLEHPLPAGTLLNLNYPAADEAKGIVAAPLGYLRYDDAYRKVMGEDGNVRYALAGAADEMQEMKDDDYSWLRRGYATATVITFNMTDQTATEAVKSWL